MSDYVFFWDGPFSQWHRSSMVINDITFNCCEQWMMYNKAIMFGDQSVARKIMVSMSPNAQKSLGKMVSPFDDAKWMETAYDIVVVGNRAKFSQNLQLKNILEATKGKTLVEASPYDRRWGIGMAVSDIGVNDPANWKGENLLGKAITQVRIEMFGE